MCAAGRSMRANRPIRAVDWYPHPPRFSRLNVSHSGPNVMFCCMGPHMARGRWGVCRQALSIWLQALSWHWIRGMLGQTAMSQPMSALMPPIGLLPLAKEPARRCRCLPGRPCPAAKISLDRCLAKRLPRLPSGPRGSKVAAAPGGSVRGQLGGGGREAPGADPGGDPPGRGQGESRLPERGTVRRAAEAYRGGRADAEQVVHAAGGGDGDDSAAEPAGAGGYDRRG
ncbi:unnamed protein product, partial [Effrenium voratum]